MKTVDLAIIGGGAAGLMCAATALEYGLSVLLLEHGPKVGRKIIISGGGRCNFTNLNAKSENYLSQNPHFVKSALKRYTPRDFLDLVESYEIPWFEKHKGQLFCEKSAKDIVKMLLDLCDLPGFDLRVNTEVQNLSCEDGRYLLDVDCQGEREKISTQSLVIATGALSIPKMGATGFAYQVAEQFDVAVTERRAGLVPLTFSGAQGEAFAELSGVALPVQVSSENGQIFNEDLLLTHRGLSGPAALQISSYMLPGESMQLNYWPAFFNGTERDFAQFSIDARSEHGKKSFVELMKKSFPQRFLVQFFSSEVYQKPLAQLSKKDWQFLYKEVFSKQLKPAGTEGYRTAEVTVGGIDTNELSSKTMEVKRKEGLYFIGEAVDVTGWLGGYNFQWAWSSARACAEAIGMK